MRRRRLSLVLAVAASGVLALLAWLLRDDGPPTAGAVSSGADTPAASRTGPRVAPSDARATRAATPAHPAGGPADATEVPGETAPGVPWARLRLVHGVARHPVPGHAGPAVHIVFPRGAGTLRLPQRLILVADGVIDVASFGDADRTGGPVHLTAEEIRAGRYEVAAYGFASRTGFTREELEGEHEILMEAAAPSVIGVLVAGPGLEEGTVEAELRRLVDPGSETRNFVYGRPLEATTRVADPSLPVALPAGRSRPTGLPRTLGPFALYELSPGTWRLDVWVKQEDGSQAHAAREFEKGEGMSDLGAIEVAAPVTIRARVVGADGTGVLDRDLSVAAVHPKASRLSPPRDPGEADPVLVHVPDSQGWKEFRGLDPDVDYRVFSPTLEVEQVVRTPAGGTRVISVELRHELRGVRCRIRFTVNGQDPVQWGEMFEGPTLDEGAWKRDGLLEQEMAPGEYLFGFFAQSIGSTDTKRYLAKFTVPARLSWEPTIDLKEDP